MKTKKVNRYYCDFCKKSGCSAYYLKRHEQRCTNNPNRVCGVCELDDKATGEKRQKPIGRLISALAENDSAGGMKALREAAGDCPACMLAAIRQARRVATVDFDFKAELKAAMSDLYDEQRGSEQYGN